MFVHDDMKVHLVSFDFFLSIGLFMIQISVNESFLVNLLQRKSMKESFLFPILESK